MKIDHISEALELLTPNNRRQYAMAVALISRWRTKLSETAKHRNRINTAYASHNSQEALADHGDRSTSYRWTLWGPLLPSTPETLHPTTYSIASSLSVRAVGDEPVWLTAGFYTPINNNHQRISDVIRYEFEEPLLGIESAMRLAELFAQQTHGFMEGTISSLSTQPMKGLKFIRREENVTEVKDEPPPRKQRA
jgi:hypothetical protein